MIYLSCDLDFWSNKHTNGNTKYTATTTAFDVWVTSTQRYHFITQFLFWTSGWGRLTHTTTQIGLSHPKYCLVGKRPDKTVRLSTLTILLFAEGVWFYFQLAKSQRVFFFFLPPGTDVGERSQNKGQSTSCISWTVLLVAKLEKPCILRASWQLTIQPLLLNCPPYTSTFISLILRASIKFFPWSGKFTELIRAM